MADDEKPLYTLYYHPFSLYSLMAKCGFVLGESLNPETAPKIELKLVNLFEDENLSEEFLTSVNQKGQVPTLTSPALEANISDSHEIATWLCKKQPELLPEEHREDIERLMEGVYDFHAKALVVAAEDRSYGIPNKAAARLEDSSISEPYRRALEIKSMFHDTTQGQALNPDNIAMVEDKARKFISKMEEMLEARGDAGPWLFGGKPTILDAHATAFVARMIDRNRDDIVTDALREYAKGTMATPEWQKVTHGRPTMWNPSLGPLEEMPL